MRVNQENTHLSLELTRKTLDCQKYEKKYKFASNERAKLII